MQNQLPNSLVMEETTCAEIINIILNMKSQSSNISTQLVKYSVESIALPLAEILNSIIRSGIFPYDLNIVKVIPLYISGDASLFAYYRTISPKCLKDLYVIVSTAFLKSKYFVCMPILIS